MGKNKVAPKSVAKSRIDVPDKPTKALRGCPCPGLKGCTLGQPVVAGEDSLILICSALSCPYEGVPVHKVCFEKYEDQLLKTLGDKGSARGWTPYKARRNLWKNNGQGLIAMCCRCICEKGNIRPTEEVVLAERILVAPLDGEKKRKTKKKELPSINMNGGGKQARTHTRLEKEELLQEDDQKGYGRVDMHTPPYTPRRTRTNSVTSFSSQSIISCTSSMYRSEDRSPPTPHFNEGRMSRRGRRSAEKIAERNEMRMRLDSGVSVRTPPASPQKELEELVPAPSPPAIVKSYAATIKSRGGVFRSTPVPSAESQSETSSSTMDTVSAPPSIVEWEKLPETAYTQSSIGWEIVSFDLYPEGKKSENFWTPWDSQDLSLTPSLIKALFGCLPSPIRR